MHDVNAIDKIEFSGSDPLSAPRQIDIQRRPIQVEIWMLCRHFALIAAAEIWVRLGNEIALNSRQKATLTE